MTKTVHVPLGTIVAFALSADNIPDGWLLCDGETIPGQYQELITALGSTNTPDFRGRTLIGAGTPVNVTQSDGTSPNFPSQTWPAQYTGGEYSHTLSTNEIPPHSHTNDSKFGYSIDSQSGSEIPLMCYEPASGTTGSTGSGAPHNNMQPYFTVHYIINCIDR
ncbi:hypothetical protein D7V80_27350 [Corallococcus sp. CA054B]|uniref:phage tail protein n=1 Tax=Corallococcus sp. CA054B TaxID=2316734 RepID=UPI000EA118D9|nr:tail fiber protein [Corallococcus sp. CA054B]RKG64310.1 hypothetical protein D7V80_27350 [Corallococcus sp. CA054B]